MKTKKLAKLINVRQIFPDLNASTNLIFQEGWIKGVAENLADMLIEAGMAI